MVKKQSDKAAQFSRRVSPAMPISDMTKEGSGEKGMFHREKPRGRGQWTESLSQAAKRGPNSV